MKDFFLQLKEKFMRPAEEQEEVTQGENYVELETGAPKEDKVKVLVRPFLME